MDIPSEVEFIDSSAFAGCTALQGIYFHGDAPAVGAYPIADEGVIAYYLEGTEGWTSPTWEGLQTASFKGFRDVLPREYYYEPVLWAVEQEITNGTG